MKVARYEDVATELCNSNQLTCTDKFENHEFKKIKNFYLKHFLTPYRFLFPNWFSPVFSDFALFCDILLPQNTKHTIFFSFLPAVDQARRCELPCYAAAAAVPSAASHRWYSCTSSRTCRGSANDEKKKMLQHNSTLARVYVFIFIVQFLRIYMPL